MNVRIPYWDLLMVIVGVICLLLKRWFTKHLGDLTFSCAGNLSASLAVYFLVSYLVNPSASFCGPPPCLNRADAQVDTRDDRGSRAACRGELRVHEWFGIMSNVYDPFDDLANAIGIGFASCVVAGLSRRLRLKGSDGTVRNAA